MSYQSTWLLDHTEVAFVSLKNVNNKPKLTAERKLKGEEKDATLSDNKDPSRITPDTQYSTVENENQNTNTDDKVEVNKTTEINSVA